VQQENCICSTDGSERVLARPGPLTRAPASDYTGATLSPERDAETSATLGAFPDCERMVATVNFDNLVAVLAVAAAVPLILAAVPRVRVPGPVLEIVAGIVLGPAVLDLVKPDQAVRLVSRPDWRSA
jgi:hypothetical protein